MDLRVYAQQSRFWVREFLVDLLGSLVPGLIFTFLAVLVMVWPFVRIYQQLIHDAKSKVVASTQAQTAPQGQTAGGEEHASPETYKGAWATFGAEIVILLVTFSYAVGFLFFRADPSVPDVRSVWANRKKLIREEAPAVYFHSDIKGDYRMTRRLGISAIESFLGMRPRYVKQFENEGKIHVEFPYLNIKNYLAHRNLHHLADIVTWKAEDKDSWPYMTTEFINVLKIRLEFALPDKCSSVTRNEAHIRFMSSMWYMARLVQWLALVSTGLVVVISLAVCSYDVAARKVWVVSVPCLGWSVLVVLAMLYVRWRIEKRLHPQRVREIVYLLETAYFATVCGLWTMEGGREVKSPEILEDLGQRRDSGGTPPPSP